MREMREEAGGRVNEGIEKEHTYKQICWYTVIKRKRYREKGREEESCMGCRD